MAGIILSKKQNSQIRTTMGYINLLRNTTVLRKHRAYWRSDGNEKYTQAAWLDSGHDNGTLTI
jgi:hypothetical protein